MHHNKATTLLITFAILSLASADAFPSVNLHPRGAAAVNPNYAPPAYGDMGVKPANVVIEDCPEEEVLAAEVEDCEDEPIYVAPAPPQQEVEVINSQQERAPVIVEECPEEEILAEEEDCIEEIEEGMQTNNILFNSISRLRRGN
jgi:hypothetical protein